MNVQYKQLHTISILYLCAYKFGENTETGVSVSPEGA